MLQGRTLIEYNGPGGRVAVPEQVTAIGDRAFAQRDDLTEVVLPVGLQSIGDFAFLDCTGLVYLDVPETVNYLGTGSFSGCARLKYILLPENLRVLPPYVFQGSGLTRFRVPCETEELGRGAFAQCKKLTQLVISENVVRIGENLVMDCGEVTIATPTDSYAAQWAISQEVGEALKLMPQRPKPSPMVGMDLAALLGIEVPADGPEEKTPTDLSFLLGDDDDDILPQ